MIDARKYQTTLLTKVSLAKASIHYVLEVIRRAFIMMLLYLASIVVASYTIVKILQMVRPASEEATSPNKKQEQGLLQRRLVPVEECLEELHQLAMGNVSVVLRFSSKLSLSLDSVEKALSNLKERHPLLRSAIVKDPLSPIPSRAGRYFREVPDGCQPILKRSDKKADEWREVWEESSNVVLDTASGPLWFAIWLQESLDENLKTYNNTIIFVGHHAIVDGISIMNIAKQFTKNLNAIAKGEGMCPERYPMSPGVNSLLAHVIDWAPWQKWLLVPQVLKKILKALLPLQSRFTKSNRFFQHFPPVFLDFPDRKSASRVVLTELSEDELWKLLERCRANECTVTGAIATACHYATADLLRTGRESEEEFHWGCAVNVRRNSRPKVEEESIGCYATLLPQKIRIPASRDSKNFWHVAAKTSRDLSRDIQEGRHLSFLKLGGLLDREAAANASVFKDSEVRAGRMDVHCLSNIGRFDWPQRADVTYDVTDAFFLSSDHLLRQVFTHFVTTTRGKLYMVTRYNQRLVKEATAKKFTDLTQKILREAIEMDM